MANDINDIYAALEAVAYTPKKGNSEDRIELLITSGNAQLELVDKLIAASDNKEARDKLISPRKDWIKALPAGQWEVKIGRMAYPLRDKAIRFKLDSLEQVRKVIEQIIHLAENDIDFQRGVMDYKPEPKTVSKKKK